MGPILIPTKPGLSMATKPRIGHGSSSCFPEEDFVVVCSSTTCFSERCALLLQNGQYSNQV